MDQAFAPTLDAEDDENEDQNIGKHMISQVAWLSTAMREVMAMLICVVLIPASSPLVTALAKICETYARLVKGKKGSHPYGPPHIQKAICLVNFLSNIPNCSCEGTGNSQSTASLPQQLRSRGCLRICPLLPNRHVLPPSRPGIGTQVQNYVSDGLPHPPADV